MGKFNVSLTRVKHTLCGLFGKIIVYLAAFQTPSVSLKRLVLYSIMSQVHKQHQQGVGLARQNLFSDE